MKAKFYTIIALLFLSGSLLAQSGSVSGTVNGSDGQPIPGVSVIVKGTTNGTTTDFDGKYTLSAASDATLVFSYVGYNTKEVKVGGKSVVNVTLQAGVALEEVVVIGSRNKNRTVTNSAVPVDVIDVKQLVEDSPQTSLNQILNYAAPSFTSNTQTISDGTDHIDPASLRGLGPDQVLVLINGKRRHNSSLVNVNGTFGRGSTGTDLNAIPSAAIERVEILRDGASALYGSDAIAGVINIVMKKATNKLDVAIGSGAYFSKNSGGYRQGGTDGESQNVSLNYGLPIGKKGGFINVTGMFDFRNPTNRMVEWEGKIFQGYNTIERLANAAGQDLSKLMSNDALVRQYAQVAGFGTNQLAMINSSSNAGLHDSNYWAGLSRLGLTSGVTTVAGLSSILGSLSYANTGILNGITDFDKAKKALLGAAGPLAFNNTDAELTARGLQRHDFNMRVGQSQLRSGKAFFNMEIPLGEDGAKFYSFGGLGYRNGNAAGFYRLPYQSRAYTPAYINGFLPEIHTNIIDKSLVVGIKGKLGDWDIDFSNTYGQNSLNYDIQNTSNATMQNATKFEFNAGGFALSQNVTNFDVTRFFDDTMAGVNVAFGAEYRLVNYQIFAGELGSYASFDTKGNVLDPTDPTNSIPVTDFYGNKRPGGSQVFPGFSPANEVNKYRTSMAGYVDVEFDFTKDFMIDAALRYENFSDFGSTTNYKIATRYAVTDNFALRGAVSSGFRAPSLPQLYFNSTSTIFVDGIPSDVGTFSNDSRVAKILGIPKLKEETSNSYSLGFTGKIPNANIKFTVDGYYIKIKNRVVYTGSFSGTTPELVRLFDQANATKAAFFANAIDTQTRGLDIVVTQNSQIGKGNLRTDLSATFSNTQQIGSIHASPQLAGSLNTYFDATSRIFLEKAVPRTKANLTFNYTLNKFNVLFRNVYFGKVTEATNTVANQQVFNGKVVTDLTFGYKVNDETKFTIGASNLLDVYPDENIGANRSSGRFLYSRRSQQFGANGRFLFARLTFTLNDK